MQEFVAVVVSPDGNTIGGGLGKASHMAVARIDDGVVTDWQVYPVQWDVLHDEGPHGTHHGRIVRFMQEHAVTRVVAAHVGAPMQNTLAKLGLTLTLDASGDARTAVLAH